MTETRKGTQRIYSLPVELTDEVMPGVVCLPHGYGHDRPGVRLARASAVAGASYNDVSDATAIDVPSGNAALNGLAVTLEAAG